MSAVSFRTPSPDRIVRAREITDALFAQVMPDALLDRPIPERHRLLFYIGHLEAFDWNLIGRKCLGLGPVDTTLDQLFAFGIDPQAGQLPQDQPSDWPSFQQTGDYVQTVRRRLDEVAAQAGDASCHMALEHRLMHAETLTYLLHNLSYDRRITRASWNPRPGMPPKSWMIEIPAGNVTLGRSRDAGFGWDNEFDEHTKYVEAFRISRYKVTNGEYLDFVNDGGEKPHYWAQRNGEWSYRGFHREVPLPLDLPVYVNRDQADAYARWCGKALPTEEQFHRAAYGSPGGTEQPFPWGSQSPDRATGNFDFSYPDLVSVQATPVGDSAFGISQMVGNGWEWTSTVFAPFDGFAPDPAYPGYSANFFDGDHYVLKGASNVTAQPFLRRSFRNWFRGSYPYAYTTFRLVEN